MRIIFFILISLIIFLAPAWAGVFAAIIYSVRWPGYEIILLGACVDSAFGHIALSNLPLYTIAATLILLMVTIVRPYIAVFDETYESV